MDGNIDTVREALEKARDALNGTEINMSNYGDEEVSALNQASTVAWWAIRDTLAALSAIDPEKIRRVALQAVRKEIEKWRDDLTCWDYDEGYLDGTDNALKIIDASILSAEPAQLSCKTCIYSCRGICEAEKGEDCFQDGYKNYRPAQDDGKPDAFASAIVKELRVNWAFDTEDALSVLNGAKRRL